MERSESIRRIKPGTSTGIGRTGKPMQTSVSVIALSDKQETEDSSLPVPYREEVVDRI
jgi:hypothetical protein